LANLVSIAAAGIIIDNFGYYVFFYGLGGLVTLSGVIAQFVLKEPPIPPEAREPEDPFWRKIVRTISPKLLKENRILTLLFVSMALSGIAANVHTPYRFQYIEHYLGFSKWQISLVGGSAIILSSIIVGIVGGISHRFNRKSFIILLTLMNCGFTAGIAFVITIPGLLIMFTLSLGSGLSVMAIRGGWFFDKYPTGDIGRFQGIRMIFGVAIPMVFGPPIGAFVIEQLGIPTNEEGLEGFIPTPWIFIVGGILSLISLIPLFLIEKSEGIVKLKGDVSDGK
jgi:MFS family permease